MTRFNPILPSTDTLPQTLGGFFFQMNDVGCHGEMTLLEMRKQLVRNSHILCFVKKKNEIKYSIWRRKCTSKGHPSVPQESQDYAFC